MGEASPSEPLTLKSLEEAWKCLQEKLKEPPPKPMRIVSHEVYKRAEEAIVDGAGAHEIELILSGASRELAKKMADNQ